jgi:hypothetical protein
MGSHIITLLFPEGKLAIRQRPKPMFAAVKMPKIGVAIRCPAKTSSTKSPKRHAVVRTIIQIAGVTDGVGLVPTEAKRTAPTR